MAQQQRNVVMRAPGFQGLNSELSPVGLDLDFCLGAENAVIDRLGRIASREAFAEYTTTFNVTFTPAVGVARTVYNTHQIGHGRINNTIYVLAIASVKQYDGSNVLLQQDHFVCLDDGTDTLNELSYPALTDATQLEGAKIVYFNDKLYIFSSGNDALVYDGTSVTALSAASPYIPPQDDSGTIASVIDGDVAISAYGRLWVTGVNGDYQTIWYSDLLIGSQWYDGKAVPTDPLNTAGFINVSEFWPNGGDRIVGLVAHNNFLVVYGRNSILFYANAASGDPAGADGIFLQDTMVNLGLVSRDAIASTGSDVLFVDDSGVRSLGRTIQEKSVPVGDLTLNVQTSIRTAIAETDEARIALSYWPDKNITVCLLPSSRVAYVLEMRQPSKTGGAKITRWNNCKFDKMMYVEDGTDTSIYLCGNEQQGLMKYEGFREWTGKPFVFKYQSGALDFGDPVTQKFIKQIDFTLFSLLEATEATGRWGYDGNLSRKKAISIPALNPAFYGLGQFGVATYGSGGSQIKRYRINTNGSGPLAKVGLDVKVNGNEVSLQEINVQTLIGRIT